MDCRDTSTTEHDLFFTIYGVGVISKFYLATRESMEKIHEPNRAQDRIRARWGKASASLSVFFLWRWALERTLVFQVLG